MLSLLSACAPSEASSSVHSPLLHHTLLTLYSLFTHSFTSSTALCAVCVHQQLQGLATSAVCAGMAENVARVHRTDIHLYDFCDQMMRAVCGSADWCPPLCGR